MGIESWRGEIASNMGVLRAPVSGLNDGPRLAQDELNEVRGNHSCGWLRA